MLIPLSKERLQQRGFNQVEGLIEGTGLSYYNIIDKKEVKASSSMNRADRLQVENPFVIKEGVKIPEKTLLFDDIYTTGATINRIKKILIEAGCQKIKTFSLVR